jgi:hypothetical protein
MRLFITHKVLAQSRANFRGAGSAASTGFWPRIVSVRGTAADNCLVHNTAQGARATPALRAAAEALIKLSGA